MVVFLSLHPWLCQATPSLQSWLASFSFLPGHWQLQSALGSCMSAKSSPNPRTHMCSHRPSFMLPSLCLRGHSQCSSFCFFGACHLLPVSPRLYSDLKTKKILAWWKLIFLRKHIKPWKSRCLQRNESHVLPLCIWCPWLPLSEQLPGH